MISKVTDTSFSKTSVEYDVGMVAMDRTLALSGSTKTVQRREMSEDLRRLVHLGGPLPADTECELVCVPTFHRPLGFRIGHGVVEVWAADDVTRCAFATDRVVSAAAASAAAQVEAPTALGRDGLVVYLRVGSVDVERHTSDQPPDDPVFCTALGEPS